MSTIVVAAAGWHGIAQLSPAMRAEALLVVAIFAAIGAVLMHWYHEETLDRLKEE
jgi:hypothetical protein